MFVVLASLVASCTTDKVDFDFTENPSVAATFAAPSLEIAALRAEDGGKVQIPMYRGNVKEAKSVEVVVEGGEGVFTPSSDKVNFAAGQSLAYLELTYDYEALSAKPVSMSVSIAKEEDLAIDGVAAATFTLVKQLTYESIGEGYYYSDFWEEAWPQEILKAKEGNYFMLPSCWVSGVDVTFFCDGETLDWYTVKSGYNYGSYGPVAFYPGDYAVTLESGTYVLEVDMTYYLPEYYDYELYVGYEVLQFPEGFTF